MLQLILARAGAGKTEYVFSSIKKLVETSDDRIILITPEQFSFVAERKLLSLLGEDKVNRVENTSFSRLSDEISRLYGGDKFPVLSKGGKAVMMKKAVNAVSDSLVLFNKNIDSAAFINSVIKIYDEMKSCRVSCDDILAAAKNSDKEILSKKLLDISNIIGAYDALISGKYYDSANELTRLYEKLVGLDYFKNKIVFIDGFSGFVAQEYKIIEIIIKQAKMVYVTFCSDSYLSNDKYDLFSYVNSNIGIIKDVAKKADSSFLNPIFLTENHRAKNEELSCIEKNMYLNTKDKYFDDVENIKIYAAKNISDECDWVSLQISKLLRHGFKASEISVICRDMEKYENEIKYSFNKYNIPYFDDQRQSINSQPLIMFVNFLLRSMIYSFRSDDIFSLLKTGLTALDDNSISNLENYVFLWNINGLKWKNKFENSTKGFTEKITENDQKLIDDLNVTREYIVSRIEKFIIKSKNKSCRDICKNIYYALLDFSADKQLCVLAENLEKNGKSALAAQQGRIWDLLMSILNQLAIAGEDDVISIKEFYKLFNLVISNEDLGNVPTGLDNVQIGSADRLRCDNPKVVFAVGANEGEFPQAVSSAGLLSESDRISLISNDFKLYSYGETLNAQERYFAYMAVSSPSEKLFVSYRSSNDNGSESSIVTNIKSIFPELKTEFYSDEINIECIESDDNAFEIMSANFERNDEFVASLKEYFSEKSEYSNRLNAVNQLVDNKEAEIKDKELARNLFADDMYLSASRIEDFYNCSFRYFCKFGLGAKARTKAQMDPMQTGTVIHFVLEKIILEKGSASLSVLSNNEIVFLVNKYLNDFLQNKMGNCEQFTQRFKYQFMRLSKMLVCVVERLKAEFEQSDFKAEAFELKIGNNEEIKSKTILLPDGGSISINGAVDRVDVYEENSKKYIRVVDYKSGDKKFQLSDVIYGLNLQMFIYLFTICQSNSKYSGISSGVLYMHSSRSVLNLNRNASESDIHSKENSSFKMKGIVLNDDENVIAEHMERDLKGKYIPVKYTKKNGITGNIVSLAQLGMISKKIDSLIEEMGISLHSGKISQNPVFGKYHDKTCDYCDYSSVCKNRKEVFNRELPPLENFEVLDILEEAE